MIELRIIPQNLGQANDPAGRKCLTRGRTAQVAINQNYPQPVASSGTGERDRDGGLTFGHYRRGDGDRLWRFRTLTEAKLGTKMVDDPCESRFDTRQYDFDRMQRVAVPVW